MIPGSIEPRGRRRRRHAVKEDAEGERLICVGRHKVRLGVKIQIEGRNSIWIEIGSEVDRRAERSISVSVKYRNNGIGC